MNIFTTQRMFLDSFRLLMKRYISRSVKFVILLFFIEMRGFLFVPSSGYITD